MFERFEVVWPKSSARRLVLRRPCIDAEWVAYHRLRRTELFERFLPYLVYDPEDPDAWTPEVFHFGLFAAGALLGCVQVNSMPYRSPNAALSSSRASSGPPRHCP